jgi:hypothetical protein
MLLVCLAFRAVSERAMKLHPFGLRPVLLSVAVLKHEIFYKNFSCSLPAWFIFMRDWFISQRCYKIKRCLTLFERAIFALRKACLLRRRFQVRNCPVPSAKQFKMPFSIVKSEVFERSSELIITTDIFLEIS